MTAGGRKKYPEMCYVMGVVVRSSERVLRKLGTAVSANNNSPLKVCLCVRIGHASSAVYIRYISVTITAARRGINQFDHQLQPKDRRRRRTTTTTVIKCVVNIVQYKQKSCLLSILNI